MINELIEKYTESKNYLLDALTIDDYYGFTVEYKNFYWFIFDNKIWYADNFQEFENLENGIYYTAKIESLKKVENYAVILLTHYGEDIPKEYTLFDYNKQIKPPKDIEEF